MVYPQVREGLNGNEGEAASGFLAGDGGFFS
jgi:hypothetical protein